MLKDDEYDPQVIALLDELKPAPARNHQIAAQARARFLAEAVSVHDKQRHSLWTIFQQKEQLAMKLMLSTLVIVGLLFGGSATVAAARDDLPNQSLYQLKLMSENVNLWFTSDPVQQVETLMQQAQIRMEEMQSLVSQGVTPPAEVAIRAQERIQRALQIAESLDESTRTALLEQMQIHLQTQEQLMDQLQQGTCTECAAVLQQTHDMLQIRLRQVEGDPANPGNMQNQQQNQEQNQNQVQTTQTPQPAGPIISPQQGTCTPVLDGTGQQEGSGNLSAGTPMQQNSNTTQNGGGTQNGTGSGGGTQNGTGSGGGTNSSPGSGGQGGKP